MKKLIAILCIFVMIISLIGCSGGEKAAKSDGGENTKAEKFKLRIASHYPEEHIAVKILKNVKEKIETETNGNIEIRIYPGGQLGDYTQVYEEVMRGTIDMAHIAIPSQYDEKIEMNFIPYLIEDYEQLEKVFAPGSYFYNKYEEIHKNQGVQLLGIYAEGFIGFGTKDLPKDLADPLVKKDALIRVPPIDVYKLVTEDMGYRTTTIPYADLYSALQTGVADGWIGGTPLLNYLQFRDAINYFIPYNVFMENTGYFINEELLNSMPEEYQKLIKDTFMEEAKNSYKLAKKNDEEAMAKLKEYGVEIVEMSNEERKSIAKHVRETTWPKLQKKFGEEIMEGLLGDIQ
ncbi:TRAP transporter substrate-binding protein DctP [Maledivibacter halophilus]|uniref:TRAP-type C4-dicarboxylate transport system, substrate-binding protein n=1 Tax=Maledivibacter halophilus TaxID=36842 RepID=A0A1T5M0S6_9FIRM|nr:TRAP transporter substrate-binding protein DctP [Maledivibacter halophilus]SKC81489.1 TRAP-type C4-dicarboxylate transport system, substrate-binding protein [Maledivibacter halophilus]